MQAVQRDPVSVALKAPSSPTPDYTGLKTQKLLVGVACRVCGTQLFSRSYPREHPANPSEL
eukprot:2637046-Prymnesium_polylepis.1